MNKQEVKKIANKISALERELKLAQESHMDRYIKSIESKIENIMSNLSLEEVLIIDEYISKNF